MLKFTPIASGSTGNLYRLESGENTLMIECGIRFPEIRKAFDFKLSIVSGCLISHGHSDHSMSADKIMKAGIDIFCTKETAEYCNLSGHRLNIVASGKPFNAGPFRCACFYTQHDCPGSVGFMISDGKEKLLFVTDSFYLTNKFAPVDILAVECNYHLPILDYNVENGLYPASNRNRVRESHMSLDTCKPFLQSQDLSKCRQIFLIHLSDANSDAALFKNEIEQATGCPVIIAQGKI